MITCVSYGTEDSADTTMWRIASGDFNDWPEHLGELKILDPCCGSGHFLVAAFSMLVPLRIERDHLTARAAVNAVLQENLHGLELDPRCVELAAFALALAAWTYPGAGGYRPLPDLNLACSGLAPNATKEQWLALAEQAAAAGGLPTERDLFAVRDSLLSLPLRNGLRALYDLFAPAPTLGSLIEPRTLKTEPLSKRLRVGSGTVWEPPWKRNGQPKNRPSAPWPRREWRLQQSCLPGATTG